VERRTATMKKPMDLGGELLIILQIPSASVRKTTIFLPSAYAADGVRKPYKVETA